MTAEPKGKRFRWERLVVSGRGPANPTTRHVLLTVATHFNKDTLVAYASMRTLAVETALTGRTVCTHMDIAVDDGWLGRAKRGKGQDWRGFGYTLETPAEHGAERASTPSRKKVLNVLQHQPRKGAERPSTPSGKEVLNVAQEGVEPDDIAISSTGFYTERAPARAQATEAEGGEKSKSTSLRNSKPEQPGNGTSDAATGPDIPENVQRLNALAAKLGKSKTVPNA